MVTTSVGLRFACISDDATEDLLLLSDDTEDNEGWYCCLLQEVEEGALEVMQGSAFGIMDEANIFVVISNTSPGLLQVSVGVRGVQGVKVSSMLG